MDITYGQDLAQFIYISYAHHSRPTSLREHIVCSHDMYSKLTLIKMHANLTSSDHLPLSPCIHIPLVPPSSCSCKSAMMLFNWLRLLLLIDATMICTHFMISKVYIYIDLLNVVILIVDLISTGKGLTHFIHGFVVRWCCLIRKTFHRVI